LSTAGSSQQSTESGPNALALRERLDRLPLTPGHRLAVAVLATAYFFELADLNTFGYAAPAIRAQWQVSIETIAFITSASFVGMFVGATLAGRLSDGIGRKRAFISAILLYTVASLLNAGAWDIGSLAAFRLATGFGLSALTVVANTYVSEFFPAHVRGKLMSMILTIGLIGIPATAWVSRLVVPAGPWGWRLVFVWGALGLVAAPFAARMLESPHWLFSKGRLKEAEAVVATLERSAGTAASPPADFAGAAKGFHEPDYAAESGFGKLFDPDHRGRTVLMLAAWMLMTLGFYGFAAWVPTLLVEHGFPIVQSLTYVSLMAICNPIGAAVSIVAIERTERKYYLCAAQLAVAVAVLLYGLTFSPLYIVIAGAIVVICMQAAVVGLYTYTPEIYPTAIRSSGVGLTFGAGRLANVAGPFLVSALYTAAGYASVFVYIAVCYVLGGMLVAIFGPRTTGRSLQSSVASIPNALKDSAARA
jgi:MFS transporter, putative metabolite:H+ symporter